MVRRFWPSIRLWSLLVSISLPWGGGIFAGDTGWAVNDTIIALHGSSGLPLQAVGYGLFASLALAGLVTIIYQRLATPIAMVAHVWVASVALLGFKGFGESRFAIAAVVLNLVGLVGSIPFSLLARGSVRSASRVQTGIALLLLVVTGASFVGGLERRLAGASTPTEAAERLILGLSGDQGDVVRVISPKELPRIAAGVADVVDWPPIRRLAEFLPEGSGELGVTSIVVAEANTRADISVAIRSSASKGLVAGVLSAITDRVSVVL